MSGRKVVIVLPAYNAERTLEVVYKKIPKEIVNGILLVDDGSKDKTVKLSKRLGIKTIVHRKNMGYGANQKTCYKNARAMGADFVIMLHPDGQYDPREITKFVKVLKSEKADVVLGSRFLGGRHETPFYRALFLRLLAFAFSVVLSTRFTEANSGYRGYTRKLLETIPFEKNGDGYIFDPQALIQSVYFGFKITEVPVSKVYNPEAISPNLRKSVEHGLENLKLLFEFLLHKWGVKKADFLT